MDSRDFTGWMKTSLDMWLLSGEAGSVMALRMARITAGGSAGSAEAKLMVAEKVRAVIELQTRFYDRCPRSYSAWGYAGHAKSLPKEGCRQ